MKTILTAIALLSATTFASAETHYVIVAFDRNMTESSVIETFKDLDDFETCVDLAVSSGEGEWTSCVPVTGAAEAYVLSLPEDSEACRLAAEFPTDQNVEACTGIPVGE